MAQMWLICTALDQMVRKAAESEDLQSSKLSCRLELGLGMDDRFCN
jgi:hypothetical protein